MHAGTPTLEVLASPQTPPRTRQSNLSPGTRPLSPRAHRPSSTQTASLLGTRHPCRSRDRKERKFRLISESGGLRCSGLLACGSRWWHSHGSDSAEMGLSFQAVGCPGPWVPRARCWPVWAGGGGCGTAFQAATGSQEMPPDWVLGPVRPWGAAGWSWPTGLGQPSIPQGVVRGCLGASCWCTLCALGAEMRCCCHLLGLGSLDQGSLLALSTQEPWGAPAQAPCSFMVSVGATVTPKVTRYLPPPRDLCESAAGAQDRLEGR